MRHGSAVQGVLERDPQGIAESLPVVRFFKRVAADLRVVHAPDQGVVPRLAGVGAQRAVAEAEPADTVERVAEVFGVDRGLLPVA